MSALPKKLRQQMENAVAEISNLFNKRYESFDIKHEQETNIFQILKLENYEIRHGSFLAFLLDPKRNVQLAKYFAICWLERIVDEIGMADSALYDILNGGEFSILPIEGSNKKYREISIREKRGQRIDHAFELKVGNRRRVFVFEYKLNGTINNNLKDYSDFVMGNYPNKQSKVYFFVLDLAGKDHTGSLGGEFQFLDKSTLVDAILETLKEAKRRDMQASRMYLEQYLELLNPNVPDDYYWKGMECQLWNMWNPEIAKYDNAEDEWGEVAEGLGLYPEDFKRVQDFIIDELFVQKVIIELSQNGIECSRHHGWCRIKLPKNSYQYFYLNCWLPDSEDQLYLGVRVASWQDKRKPEAESQKQFQFALKTILQSACFRGMADSVDDIKSYKNIHWSVDSEVVWKKKRHASSKKPYDSNFSLLVPISLADLETICTTDKKIDIFDTYIKHVIDLYNSCNQ